jgi:hypothetical protein
MILYTALIVLVPLTTFFYYKCYFAYRLISKDTWRYTEIELANLNTIVKDKAMIRGDISLVCLIFLIMLVKYGEDIFSVFSWNQAP